MSSLLLIPTLLRQLPRAAKLAVLTADSTCCSDDLLGLDDPAQRSRIVIAGIEGTKYWHDAMLRPLPPIDVPAIERDVAACVARLRAQHPEIAAILFECTAFPLVAKSIRDMTELPVYDITSLCLLVIPPIA
ncbi:MAG: hypothetical protein E5Y85_09485 [Mesorhizobium sp.]|nr:MAG: hypothetical protein E5Y85_09485 [Mesorhizobium sp.]TIM48647.1 MAG: hypothetical protein E5Y56_06500 [Mesorhizobium sp.]